MGIITNLKEKRSTTLSKPGQWLIDELTGGSQSYTGKGVTQETALTLTAVYACVRILSETVASLPLPVYRRLQPRGKERATNYPLYPVLHDMANDEMTSFTFRETMMNHLLLWGNAYSYIERDNGQRIRALWPLLPDRTEPYRTAEGLIYKTALPNGEIRTFDQSKILHIPGMGYDGLVGYNPIRLAREAIGMGLAAEEYGARFFGNGAKPGGVLEHPNHLKKEAQDNLRSSWNDMHQGLERQHRIAILEEGMTYKQIGIPPDDAQFLETRKFQVTEIARFFRVPPHMLADLERATFSNIEQQSIDFVTHSIRPWLVRWEHALNTKLFSQESRKQFFAEFVVEGLLRGDTQSRYEAYATARQNGWLSANDIRELENMNPIDNGDVYLIPLNMIPADSVEQVTESKIGTSDNQTDNSNDGQSREKRDQRQQRAAEIRMRVTRSYQRIFDQAFEKIINREKADVMREAEKQIPNRSIDTFNIWLSDFYRDHEDFIRNQLLPIYLSVAESMKREAANEVGGNDEMTPELKQFVNDYLALLIRRHNGRSVNGIRDVIQNSDDIVQGLKERFTEWQEKRVDDEAKEENVRSSNAFTKASFVALGVTKLRWVADSSPCPYCQKLDGNIIDIHSSFIRQGEQLTPDGQDPFIPDGNVSHAPIHSGCECTIAAEI